jgi:hypothetical protein
MSAFTPLKRNCPVCDGARRDCRRSTANPVDYVFRGLDRQGFGMWAEKMEAEAHSEQQREEWRRQRAQLLSESERDREIRKVFDQLSVQIAAPSFRCWQTRGAKR